MKSNATKNIIVVDDDESVLNSIRYIFRHYEYNVDFFNNPISAYKSILVKDYNIIISDIEMPEMSGIEMILNLKKIKSLQKIIFMSANIDVYKESIKNITCNILCKPIKKYQILDIIKN